MTFMSDTVRVSKGKLDELISVARSINRGKAHEIRVPGDDEPCYLQRKEWVDWAVTACEELVEDLTASAALRGELAEVRQQLSNKTTELAQLAERLEHARA